MVENIVKGQLNRNAKISINPNAYTKRKLKKTKKKKKWVGRLFLHWKLINFRWIFGDVSFFYHNRSSIHLIKSVFQLFQNEQPRGALISIILLIYDLRWSRTISSQVLIIRWIFQQCRIMWIFSVVVFFTLNNLFCMLKVATLWLAKRQLRHEAVARS